MDGEEKNLAIFIVSCAVVFLGFIGWGVSSSNNTHNFEVKCVESGKTVQWESLPGQSTAYRECK